MKWSRKTYEPLEFVQKSLQTALYIEVKNMKSWSRYRIDSRLRRTIPLLVAGLSCPRKYSSPAASFAVES